MIIIFAAFKNEVKDIIKKIKPAGKSKKAVMNKNDIYHGYIGSSGEEQEVMVCVTGMGAAKALKAVSNIIDMRISDIVFLILGISGSTDENLSTGDIIIHDKIINAGFLKKGREDGCRNNLSEVREKIKIEPEIMTEDFIDSGCHWRSSSHKILIGPGACVPFLICTHKDKKYIGESLHVSAIDMESYSIARIAKANKIPVAVVRAVSDDIFTEIPDYFQDFEKRSLADKSVIVLKIIFSFKKLQQIIKISKGIKKAVKNLNHFAIKEIIPFIKKKYFNSS
ncbi:MAG: hypothetical protein PHU65_00940 [Actinomycetota bacterium]|nr:hypothetical protein [Actinomycetota bacterium]